MTNLNTAQIDAKIYSHAAALGNRNLEKTDKASVLALSRSLLVSALSDPSNYSNSSVVVFPKGPYIPKTGYEK